TCAWTRTCVQAMRDFRSMFPEMEAGVIEAVLRANGGAVDATIDQLLAMATDNDNERLRTELEATENAEAPPHYSPPGGPTPPPSYQQATRPMHRWGADEVQKSPGHAPISILGEFGNSAAPCGSGVTLTRQLDHRGEEQPQPQPPPTSHRSQWKPPLLGPLPPTFLRLTPSPGPSQVRGQCWNRRRKCPVIDERMAILLQNQEFVRQLRGNRDFMTTLHRGGPDSEEADAAFKERLKSMGKASRRKFAQLARLFS
ncbi:conserved hypothetical protein, partial [Ixodes scapularis]